MRIRRLSRVLASVLFVWGCSDSSGPPPVEGLVIQSGNSQSALAGTPLPAPVVIVLQDASGGRVLGQTATFTVTSGGGFLSSNTAQSNPDGTITAPTWTLGKSAVPQQMEVAVGGKTVVVDATVQTAYTIEVRFFGPPLSANQQALFTSAAARVRAMIVGALPPVDVTGDNPSGCTGSSMAPLTGSVNGLLIFAQMDSIDGPGQTLAQAGPCAIRVDQNGVLDYRTVYGVMIFDSADVRQSSASFLQTTITHEMLHVVGFGTYWTPKNLLINEGAPGTAYVGPGGIAGCRAVGGTATCTSSVPVEDCVGRPNCGAGNRDSHWRETTFGPELMTGFVSSGLNPLSVMTIRSFEDLNYSVNPAAADAYTIFIGSLSAGGDAFSSSAAPRDWERPLRVPLKTMRTIRADARK